MNRKMAKRLLSDDRGFVVPTTRGQRKPSARKVLGVPRARVSGSGSAELARWIAVPYIAGGPQHS